MNPLAVSLPTLAVSAVFCLWNAYQRDRDRRGRRLRERVAFMVWVAAWQDG
jgi:hypothetical protein